MSAMPNKKKLQYKTGKFRLVLLVQGTHFLDNLKAILLLQTVTTTFTSALVIGIETTTLICPTSRKYIFRLKADWDGGLVVWSI
jgi:hypothetical protein